MRSCLAPAYTAGQMSYDLTRLCLKGLITRLAARPPRPGNFRPRSSVRYRLGDAQPCPRVELVADLRRSLLGGGATVTHALHSMGGVGKIAGEAREPGAAPSRRATR